MDPDVIAQLEEQIRIMNELLAQQNAMMASQLGAMKGAAGKMDAASTSYVSRMNSASQSTTKYMESQEKVRDQANASVEKWSNRVRDSERAIAGFNLVLGNAAGIVGSFGTALLSAEKGFSKYGATADAAAGAAQSLASALPIVGQALGGVVGAVGKVASKVVGDALKLTDSIINLREETVKVAGALPVSSEGLLKLANEAKYFGENIQVLGKITQGIGTGLTSLGMTAGQGATKFMEMANVTEETRQRFGKLGISQEELTQMQATYIKQQQSSGLALTLQTRSVEQLRKQSLKYAEDLNALTGLTGKAADQLRAEQEQAAAVLQEKIAQRQDMMELQRLKQDGRTAEAAELEAKIQATAKFRDTMANLVGPEQAAQMMRVVRTGVYDNISGPLANMGLDFQEIRNQLQQGKDGMKVAAEFAGEVRGAQDRMLGPNGLGGAALFLDEEQFKQLGGNLESLSRLSDTYGKSMTEMLEAEKKAQAERQKGSPMDDAIEKARSAERALQQKYQEFLIDGIKKAAALLNATDLNKLAADAMALATKAAYVGLGILTVATGALLFAKRREVVASREAREAQRQFTKALQQSTAAMRNQTSASRSAAAADRQEAAGSRNARAADLAEANASRAATRADTQEAAASRRATQADLAEASASQRAAAADIREAAASMKAAAADLREARASDAAARADMREAASGGGGFGGSGGSRRGGGRGGGRGGRGIGGGIRGGIAGILGTLLLDAASEAAFESGHEKVGAGLSIGSSAAAGAGTGAMIGSVVPVLGTGVGAAIGGALGGLYGLFQNRDIVFGGGENNQPSATESLEGMNQQAIDEQLAILGSISGTNPSMGTPHQYVVQEGDTLRQIAEQIGISPEELLKANPSLKNSQWNAGYKLNIPGELGGGISTLPTDPSQMGKIGLLPTGLGGAGIMPLGGIPGQEQLEQAFSALDATNRQTTELVEEQQSATNSLVGSTNNYSETLGATNKQLVLFRDLLEALNRVLSPTAAASGSAAVLGGANTAGGAGTASMTGGADPTFGAATNGDSNTTGAPGATPSMPNFSGNTMGGGMMPGLLGMPNGMMGMPTTGFDGNMGRILATIRARESRGDYSLPGPKGMPGTASGAYAFIDSSWRALTKKYGVGAEYARAFMAPPAIQDQVAARYVQEILEKAGGDVSKVPLAWYTGNIHGNISSKAMAINGGLTPQAYQAKWMATYMGQSDTAMASGGGMPMMGMPMMGMMGMMQGDGGLINNLAMMSNMMGGMGMMGMMGGANFMNPYFGSSGMGMSNSYSGLSMGMGANPNIVQLGRMLQAQGLRVSENPAFGGVNPVHKGRGHYEGRAIDVNVGLGNKEAYDPILGARFDQLAAQLRQSGYHVVWRAPGHYDHMHVEVPGLKRLPMAEKGGVFKGPDSGYLAMLHGKEAVVPLDNKFTRTQSSESYTVNGKPATKKEYDSFMKSHPELQNIQNKVQAMMGSMNEKSMDPSKIIGSVNKLMDNNLTGIKDEIIDKNEKIQQSLLQMVNAETNKAIKAVNEANQPLQMISNEISNSMRKVMTAHNQTMSELTYKLSEMIDALNTSNDVTKKILKKAST